MFIFDAWLLEGKVVIKDSTYSVQGKKISDPYSLFFMAFGEALKKEAKVILSQLSTY